MNRALVALAALLTLAACDAVPAVDPLPRPLRPVCSADTKEIAAEKADLYVCYAECQDLLAYCLDQGTGSCRPCEDEAERCMYACGGPLD